MMEYEEYQDEAKEDMKKWLAMLPDEVKKAFPDFSDIDLEDYIY